MVICILGLGNACSSGHPLLTLAVVSRVSSLFDLYPGFPTVRPLHLNLVLNTISVLGGSLMCNPTPIKFAPPGGTLNTVVVYN